MRRIGFRRLLPVLFTCVHAVLLIFAVANQQQRMSEPSSGRAVQPVWYQEGTTLQWEGFERKPLTAAHKFAIVIDLPAFVAASPIVGVFFRGSDLALLCASLLFVPLVWYGVGRWIDRLLGYTPPLRKVRRNWRGLFATLSAGLLFLSIVGITPINHHRVGDTYWIGAGLILWSSLSLAICMTGLRQRIHS